MKTEPRVSALIARIVAACARHHWLVVVLAAAAGAGALGYVERNIAIDTDAAKLIAEEVSWRKRELAFDAAFPHRADLIAVVVDATTPELAEQATGALAAQLSNEHRLFRLVWRPDGGPFFDRVGLLFQSTDEVARTTQALIAAQPLLGTLAGDPSLRGLMDALTRFTEGAQADPSRFDELTRPLRRLADVFERIAAQESPSFSWRELITGQAPDRRELRRFILVQPVLDYGALQPGQAASAAIRHAARALGFDADARVRVRLTGPVPLADEEFATLADRAGLNATFATLAVVALLWAALRSWRPILAIVLCLAVGLIVTAAFGLLLFGAFNLISAAFAVLFVGLGVDFGIQFCVCYRAQRHAVDDLHLALSAAGEEIGPALALAAVAIASGFYAFLPTDYRGVSELGVIAGTGMLIAFVCAITLLPALMALLRPPREPASVGLTALAPLDRLLLRRRRLVLALGGVVAAGSVVLLPRLQFDFNPLHLRSGNVESVSTLVDLMRDPNTTPNTIDVLTASVADAALLGQRLEELPEVDHALTLASFVPERQDEKLALIDDAALLLDPVLNAGEVKPPPEDKQTAHAMSRAAEALERMAVSRPQTPAAAEAVRLGKTLKTLAQGDAGRREHASAMLIPGLVTVLAQLRAALQPRPVTLADIPEEVRRDWVAADGRARVEVFPSGDPNDNATIERFVTAVLALAPQATGAPVSTRESTGTIVVAFAKAGLWAFVSIVALLALALRRTRDVVLALTPLLLSALATFGTCAAIGLALNFANIIALPLLFGIGVAFDIYLVMAWRAGRRELLQSSLTRAVIFSALTTGTAFGSLWLSRHPGTASMGELLALALACTIASALLFLPALLGEPHVPR